RYNRAATGVPQIVEAVENAGYGTEEPEEAAFHVNDSARPGGSATFIENRLKALPGVLEATFDLANERVWTRYLPSLVSERDIRLALREIGYDARREDDAATAAAPARDEESASLMWKLAVAVVFGIPVTVISMADMTFA